MSDRREASANPVSEPIAVIGLGCRFPGGVQDAATFWALLSQGRDAIGEIPASRWSIPAHFSADRGRPGKSYARHGGFLERIEWFDAEFFGISPREAVRIDPQQRLLLELAFEAFEDAGLGPEKLAGRPASVFIAIAAPEYYSLQVDPAAYPLIDTHTGTGLNFSIAANRISYFFDLRGPSVALDTACSGSLVAVHQACQSIWHEGCELAVAGGVQMNLKPDNFIMHSKAAMLSPTGRCRAFDASGDGFVRSEGAGLVVLKPLARALRDGDRIWAVIRGMAVNQDGRTVSITMPNGEAQTEAVQTALRRAGVQPAEIQYVEAHGPGTPVGDPIEAEALGRALNLDRAEACVVGSVKTNLGHLEAAAGIAGFIKLVLALKHRQIPPNLHFEKPNPKIPLAELNLRIPTTLEPWPANRPGSPRLAGINSFGFGGTNVHAILSEAPEPAASTPPPAPVEARPELLLLSARSAAALGELAQAYVERVSSDAATVSDICYSAAVRRGHHPHRLAMAAGSTFALKEQLEAFAKNESHAGMHTGRLGGEAAVWRPLFVYSGMGQQWPAMGRQLLEQEPVFRAAVESCERELRAWIDWSVLEVLVGNDLPMDRTEIAQIAIFALQTGLTALWRSWGVEAGAVVGHSVGEVAAAHAAGILTLAEAVRVVYHRSRLQASTAGQGTMLAVGLPAEAARERLAGYESLVSLAALNSPRSVTLAGDAGALQAISEALTREQIFNRFLKVEVPYHSPLMAPLMGPLESALAGLKPQRASLPFYSTVAGGTLAGPELDGRYWARNMREPVRFAEALLALARTGVQPCLELSAHPVLSTSLKECGQTRVFASLRRGQPQLESLLSTLGEWYTHGYPVDWSRIYPKARRFVSLPGYPWQRQAYWQEGETTRQHRLGETCHPLLGRRLNGPQPVWENEIDFDRLPYLKEHRIHDEAVYPATAYGEMAVAAAAALLGPGVYWLSEVRTDKALVLTGRQATRVRLTVPVDGASFAIHSLQGTEWLRHAYGKFARQTQARTEPSLDIAAIRQRCPQHLSGSDCYAALRSVGYDYGRAFQGARQAWQNETETLFETAWPEGLPRDATGYHCHPAVIDAYLNGILALILPPRAWLPVAIDELTVYGSPAPRGWAYLRRVRQSATHLQLDWWVTDEAGRIQSHCRGMHYRALNTDAKPLAMTDAVYGYAWEMQNPARVPVPTAAPGRCLVLADAGGVGRQLAECWRALGGQCEVIAPEDPAAPDSPAASPPQALSEAVRERLAGLGAFAEAVYCRALDTHGDALPTAAALFGGVGGLAWIQALAELGKAPRLWLVTRGVQAPEGAPGDGAALAQAPLWGVGRVLANELPALRPRLVDLGAGSAEEIADLCGIIAAGGDEDELALRGTVRYAHRLQALPLVRPGNQTPFRLAIRQAGTIEGLILEATDPEAPQAGQIALEIRAAGLNFKDVVKTMNLIDAESLEKTYSGKSLGLECSGVVTAVGEGVEGFRVGDAVIALAPHAMGTHTITTAAMAARKPAAMGFEEAAVLPVAYMTAWAALCYFGRLEKGERALIHTATGGVGQAAVQIARQLGIEVLATAGSPEKRAYLEAQGVRHVMDSRTLDFAEEVRQATGGAGVDLVLNTLPPRTIPLSLSILRARGRFIDLSNIYSDAQIDLSRFQKGLTVTAFDLDQLMRSDPEFIARLFQETLQFVVRHQLPALPRHDFPIGQAKEAFRFMAQAKHIGKVALVMRDLEQARVDMAHAAPPVLRAEASYLVTGGLSGFGLESARWLVRQGARHLGLVSRRGAATVEAQNAVAELRAQGVEVAVWRADAGRFEELAAVLAEHQRTLPPLRGVIHAAAVYADQTFAQLTEAGFDQVLGPKAAGAWNLHRLTRDLELDFFVMYSSVAATVGNPGQANYAAANCYLDQLAAYRRALGLPALSVAWGGIGEVGYLARQQGIGQRLAQSGIELLSPVEALRGLGVLLRQGAIQATVAPVQWAPLSRRFAALRGPRFHALVPDLPPGETEEAESQDPADLDPATRISRLAAQIAKDAARILGTSPDRLDLQTPLTQMGLDSLMAVELSQQLKQRLGVDVPSMKLLVGGGIAKLAEQLAAQLAPTPAAPSPRPVAEPVRPVSDELVPLSYQQAPIWALQRSRWDQPLFNLPTLVRFRGPLNVGALGEALRTVVRRHAPLRARMVEDSGQWRQRFEPVATIELPLEDYSSRPASEPEAAVGTRFREESRRPFELTREPPVRARLLRLGTEDHALLATLHHAASDGASLRVFFEELLAVYAAATGGPPLTLPPLTAEYAEFVRWQHEYFHGDRRGQLAEAWRRRLDGRLPQLELPLDRPRPAQSSCRGVRHPFAVPGDIARALRELTQARNCTLFMTLQAALAVLIQQLTRQEDLCLGTFVANRTRAEWRALIGCFVNCVPLRVSLAGDPTFVELLGRVRRTTVEALDHAELPFPLLLEAVAAGQPPLQVVLILHSEFAQVEGARVSLPGGLEATFSEGDNGGAKRDWTFHLFDSPAGLGGYLEYDTDLFTEGGIIRLLDRFGRLLREIVAEPNRAVSRLGALEAGRGGGC